MRYINLFPISFFVLIILSMGCQKTINFLDVPVEGNIAGIVRDSLTKRPIPGAEVVAEYVRPNDNEGQKITKSVATTNDGSFIIKDVWDEVLISVRKDRFEPVSFTSTVDLDTDNTHFDIVVKGLPVVYGEFIDEKSFDYQANDSSKLILELRDLYNDVPGDFLASVFFYGIESDLNVAQIDLDTRFKSQSFVTMGTVVAAEIFPDPKGVPTKYSYYYEYTDPDGNTLDYGLAEEEILDTLIVF